MELMNINICLCIQVRHAQGTHNVAAEENSDALMSYDLLDAPLSTAGWQQVYISYFCIHNLRVSAIEIITLLCV